MAASPARPKKASSGWGSLLSGAVAGLESRLDAVLGDDDQASAKSRAADEAAKEARQAALKSERPASRNRTNDRLQERLAKAMADKSKSASNLPSRTASPTPGSDSIVRSSMDSQGSEGLPQPPTSDPVVIDHTEDPEALNDNHIESKVQPDVQEVEPAATDPPPEVSKDVVPRISAEIHPSDSVRPSIDSARLTTMRSVSVPITTLNEESQPTQSAAEYQATLDGYLERIDALHAKITFLATSASAAARDDVQTADLSSTKRKLAEKDEKIAELIKEGTALSSKEVKAMNLVRTLRERIKDIENGQAKLKSSLDTANQNAIDAKNQAERSEARSKEAAELLKTLGKAQKELEVLKSEKSTNEALIIELRRQLVEAEKAQHDSQARAQAASLEQQSKRITDLEEELASTKIEKQLAADRARKEANDLSQQMTREQEKAVQTEAGLKSEIQSLESKLEVLRVQSESLAADSPAVAQGQLLRQVETLQAQYDLARQNWQGIENGLNARISALEKDKDDLTKREAESRKKTRDATSKARKLEEEMESIRDRNETLHSELSELQTANTALQSRIESSEKTAQETRLDMEKQQRLFEETLQARVEEAVAKVRLELATRPNHSVPPSEMAGTQYLRAASPATSRKHSATGLFGFGFSNGRNTSSASNSRAYPSVDAVGNLPSLNMDHLVRPPSRRTHSQTPSLVQSAHPLRSPVGPLSPTRQSSSASLTQINGKIPSIVPAMDTYNEEDMDRETVNSSPHRTINDLVSVSTVGAGPSVQLVERMSAAVRRLESEKAAAKEEMIRLTGQRNEARDEVVKLMRDTESLQGLQDKVSQMEGELGQLRQRYETALEMVGEKSEECDELKVDLADLKKVYRELADRTMT